MSKDLALKEDCHGNRNFSALKTVLCEVKSLAYLVHK